MVDKGKDEGESSSAKLGFEVIMLNRANVLAGHLQTHPIILAKTAIGKLTAVNSGSFPSDDAAKKLVYLAIRGVEKKWKRASTNWSAASIEFVRMFGDRFL